MRYNPRTDNAMDMDEIARQCMDAVIATALDHPLMMWYHGDINYVQCLP